jgi:hypothetical protein
MPVVTIRWQPGAETRLDKILLLEFSDHLAVASANVNGHNQILLVAAGVVHYRGDVLEIDSANDEARMTNVKRMTNYRLTNGENDLVANFVIPMQAGRVQEILKMATIRPFVIRNSSFREADHSSLMRR